MAREIISTDQAPQAIGTYSQAVKVDNTVYLSGQIPLVPESMELVEGDIETQIVRVFENLKAVAAAAGADFSHVVKLNVFLTDLANFPVADEDGQQVLDRRAFIAAGPEAVVSAQHD